MRCFSDNDDVKLLIQVSPDCRCKCTSLAQSEQSTGWTQCVVWMAPLGVTESMGCCVNDWGIMYLIVFVCWAVLCLNMDTDTGSVGAASYLSLRVFLSQHAYRQFSLSMHNSCWNNLVYCSEVMSKVIVIEQHIYIEWGVLWRTLKLVLCAKKLCSESVVNCK